MPGNYFKVLLPVVAVLAVACSQSGKAAPKPDGESLSAPLAQAVSSERMGNWAVNTAQSHVNFTATQQGEEFNGEFNRFNAVINFNADRVENASVSASIDLSSLDAKDKDRNDALPGKEWFFVKNFPTASFISDDFVQIEDGRYEARGTLSIKGIDKPLTLPFTLDMANGNAVMNGRVTLDRTLWNIGTGSWADGAWVGKEVVVDIKIAASNPY